MIFLEIVNRKSLFPFAVALQPFLDHSLSSSETLFLLFQKKLNLPLSSQCLFKSKLYFNSNQLYLLISHIIINSTPLIMYKFPLLKLVMAIECYYCCNLKNIKCVQATANCPVIILLVTSEERRHSLKTD